ncbi:hypothetical protein S7711_07064 [Stachybotrys chartarum IBT 7711]|uniref:Uncharacterized protein n=1 Tax=Stachybotrys chartarum (strain CBS 109288 / IBT 7711) TaxID=1280523 RepID=A0A084AP60_STACB|nr:hypothetical protein S7711_07064 [Stachybotrys chartarum IBT 7711]
MSTSRNVLDYSFKPLSYSTSVFVRSYSADKNDLLAGSIQSTRTIEDDVLPEEYTLGRTPSWHSAYRVISSGIGMILSIIYVIIFRPDTELSTDLRNSLSWDYI